MEISPKLTSASSLNANVAIKGSAEADASTETLKNAAENNSAAASDIVQLTTNPETAAVASANLSSSRVSESEVDALVTSLKQNIAKDPETAIVAATKNLTSETVKLFLA